MVLETAAQGSFDDIVLIRVDNNRILLAVAVSRIVLTVQLKKKDRSYTGLKQVVFWIEHLI